MPISTEDAERAVEWAAERAATSERGTEISQKRAVISIILSIVEFVLSVVNGIKEDGFDFSTPKEFVLGAAPVMKLVGLLFMLNLACNAYANQDYSYGKGGPPITLIWLVARNKLEDSFLRTAVIQGFGLQAFAIWVCFLVYLFVNVNVAIPGSALFFSITAMAKILCHVNEHHGEFRPKREREEGTQAPDPSIYGLGHLILLLIALFAPVVLEAAESVVNATQEEKEPLEILQAIITAALAFGAIPFVCSFLCEELPAMWNSVMTYHS